MTPAAPRRLRALSAGFLTDARLRRILALAGHRVAVGLPRADEGVIVWGRRPSARRGERVAAARGAALVRVEDAFLRGIRPGRRTPPMGLLIDPEGVHFDPSAPSLIETIAREAPLDDTPLLARAHAAIARLRALDLSKYNSFDPGIAPPAPGYALIVDQAPGDASLIACGAGAETFRRMLAAARADWPGAPVLVRRHPAARGTHLAREIAAGEAAGIGPEISPWQLLEGAVAVYTVSSQMGFEAILAGHRPRVFGGPFYAGWGLSDDEMAFPRRGRRLTRAQLFAAAMILAPVWHDPFGDRLCSLEDAIEHLAAEVRAFREDRRGHVALGMRLWKRAHLQRFFGRERPMRFASRADRAVARAVCDRRGLMVWAGQADRALEARAAKAGVGLVRVEDGILRSRGLGAALVPPLALVADDLGIYYDPARESRLDRLIADSPRLPPDQIARAERLMARLRAAGLSKYSPGGGVPELAPRAGRRRILVAGQVEDDASILCGCGALRTNLALLERARAEHPDAQILYKPHPDVEAGLRPGAMPAQPLAALADAVLAGADPAALLGEIDALWTMTSTLGFEALIRGVPVMCLGMPFYAGWGLTADAMAPPSHRAARPTLAGLVHAVLIGYPRYLDPVTGRPCPVEVVLDRLEAGAPSRPGLALRLLAKAQGAFAGQAWLWR